MNHMISIEGRVVLVTGGSRGIGEAAAKLMARAGAQVALTYATKKTSAQRVAQEIREAGGECLIVPVTAEDRKSVRAAVKTVLNHFGRSDILVNYAGIWKRGDIGAMTEAQWDETLDVNLKGTFLFCNEVVPIMKKQKSGRIINIASTAGQRGEANYSHYAASKGGVIAFSKSIAAELARYNILVNVVSPGWVTTDMTAHVLGRGSTRREIEKLIPRGRVATPEDIAGPALFLASELANHVVGAVINVNGGSVLSG